MKKLILFSSCVLLFLLTTACSKQNETILLLSAHTWVVTSNSFGGSPSSGDEYNFYDNRVFIHSQSGIVLVDGKWDFDSSYPDNKIYIPYIFGGSITSLAVKIGKLTNTELELELTSSSTIYTIKLTPKQ